MPPVLAAIAATAASVAAGAAAAGTALGVAAGALAAGNLALAGTALLAVGDASLIGTFTVGSVLELGALAGVSAMLAPHPKVNTAGSPQQFKPDTNAALPWVEGRYGVGGNLVYETTSGGGNSTAAGAKGNEYLTQFTILSVGPIQEIETLRFNDTILTWDPNGQACTGGYIPQDEVQSYNPGYKQNSNGSYQNNNYQDHCWQNTQLGSLTAGYFAPPAKLASDNAALTEWTQAHGFSGFAASALTLVYDQRYYSGGVPQYQWTLKGGLRYDPRQDSTYPGGAGMHRWAGVGASAASIAAAWGSWTFNQNPIIAALNFALGYYRTDPATGVGRLYAGIGAGVAGVDIPAFIRAANVADANGWLICGQWTTGDGKWDVLNEMLKAGSASAVVKNGIISCIVDTPLTALNPNNPITSADLTGAVKLPTGSSVSARINTIFPRFSSEAHRWQMVPADTPVKAATYVAEDGGVRSKTMDWQYVPAVNQACQVAAYTICNSREIAGIELPGKPKLRNYAVGDCVLVDIPEAGLASTKVMVTKRLTDPMTGGVTLTVRTETDAKHPYSLGVSGVAPATPGISGYDPTIVDVPLAASWASGAITYTDASTDESRSIIQITGAADSAYAQDLLVRYRLVAQVNGSWAPLGSGQWAYKSFPATQSKFELDLNPGAYDVQIAYVAVGGAYPAADQDWLDLGVETIGGSTASNTANVGSMSADDIVSQLKAADGNVTALLGSVNDPTTGLSAVNAAVQAAAAAVDNNAVAILSGVAATANERAARLFGTTMSDGTPVRDVTADSAEAIGLLGSISNGNFVLSDDTVVDTDGNKVTTSLRQVAAAVDGTPTQPGLQAQITSLSQATTDTTNNNSLASKLDQVTATVDGSGATPSLSAQIASLAQATTDTTSATSLATKLDQVTATVDGASGQPGLQAQITDLASATTDATNDTSLASKLEQVTATVNGVGDAPSLSAQILSLKTATTDTTNPQSIASELDAVVATVNGVGDTPGLTAQVATLKTATTDTSNGTSLASLLETVTSTVGQAPDANGNGGSGLQAQVYTAAQTAADASGKLAARLVQGVQAGTGDATVTIESDGVTGLIKLVAQALVLANTANGQEIDILAVIGGVVAIASQLRVGNYIVLDPVSGSIYFNHPAIALALGGPFGANGDLVFWVGAGGTALGGMTRSNADMYFGTNRAAYFGGSLSAGTLTTKAATSDTSAAAQTETAVFGSNGGTITVTLSYTYADVEVAHYAAGDQSDYNAAKAQLPNVKPDASDSGFTAAGQDPGGWAVALYRSVNGGPLTQVTTLTGQGSWNAAGTPPDSGDPGAITYSDNADGSLTYTDPQQVAQNRQYQAVLTSRNPRYAGAVTQNISLICVEQ